MSRINPKQNVRAPNDVSIDAPDPRLKRVRLLAKALDNSITIPGTGRKIELSSAFARSRTRFSLGSGASMLTSLGARTFCFGLIRLISIRVLRALTFACYRDTEYC